MAVSYYCLFIEKTLVLKVVESFVGSVEYQVCCKGDSLQTSLSRVMAFA